MWTGGFRPGLIFPRPALVCRAPGGVLAQLVERYNGIVEVSGSTPLHSTSFNPLSKAILDAYPPWPGESPVSQAPRIDGPLHPWWKTVLGPHPPHLTARASLALSESGFVTSNHAYCA